MKTDLHCLLSLPIQSVSLPFQLPTTPHHVLIPRHNNPENFLRLALWHAFWSTKGPQNSLAVSVSVPRATAFPSSYLESSAQLPRSWSEACLSADFSKSIYWLHATVKFQERLSGPNKGNLSWKKSKRHAPDTVASHCEITSMETPKKLSKNSGSFFFFLMQCGQNNNFLYLNSWKWLS